MIICEVNKNHLNIRTRELLTAGSQNVNTVEFRFNEAWDGLAKTATFKTSKKTISVLLNTNTTAIPWEALADAGEILAVGVFGVSGETIVLPTVWGILGKVMDAAHLGDEEKEPTPDVYQKILDELNALERPTWDSVQNKPFSTLGGGLAVDENGVLSAQGGGSANAVQYVAQSLTDEQKKQARTNIGASPIPTVRYWLNLKTDNIINLYDMGVGYGIISPVDYDQTVPTGMSSPMLVIFGRMSYGRVDITVYDGAGAVWRGSLNLSSQTTDVAKTGDYVTNTALTDILQGYVPLASWDDVVQQIGQAIGTKLDKNQGTTNAGKILGVGEDGNVVPQDKPSITVDSALSSTSENPVQNKIITAALAEKITAPTTAAVGQIIKVKSVDTSGKPTEWEAVDMPSGGGGETWEKLVDTTLAEAVESVTYTFDNCKRIKALIAPAIANGEYADGWKRFTINNVAYPTINGKLHYYQGICFKIDSEYPPYVQEIIGNNFQTVANGIIGGNQTAVLENIAPNGVTEFGCQTAALLKTGTKIEIWGIKS